MLRSAVLAIIVAISVAAGAWAGEVANPAGKFSVWLPDLWTVKHTGNRLDAHNPPNNIQVLVVPLKDDDADVVDEDVTDVVDDELDDMKVLKDEKAVHLRLQARRVQGTGNDEGDDVVFRVLAVDPGGKSPVVVALVYGETDVMARGEIQGMVERILTSLKVEKPTQ